MSGFTEPRHLAAGGPRALHRWGATFSGLNPRPAPNHNRHLPRQPLPAVSPLHPPLPLPPFTAARDVNRVEEKRTHISSRFGFDSLNDGSLSSRPPLTARGIQGSSTSVCADTSASSRPHPSPSSIHGNGARGFLSTLRGALTSGGPWQPLQDDVRQSPWQLAPRGRCCRVLSSSSSQLIRFCSVSQTQYCSLSSKDVPPHHLHRQNQNLGSGPA